MQTITRAILLASCCAAAGAQSVLTSPSGYLAAEGDSYRPWLVAAERRFQQVDATHRGVAWPALRAIAFRRDATPHPGYTQPSKTFDLGVLMGYSDLATFGATFAANYKVPPTTVVQPRQVSVPDWTQVPPVAPAAFDFVVPFDAPWSYSGQDDWLWEVVMQNGPTPGPGEFWFTDGQTVDGKNTINGFTLGQGCKVGEVQFGMSTISIHLTAIGSVTSDPRTIQVTTYVTPSNAAAATVLALGDQDPNAAVPGLCGNVRTNALVVVPMLSGVFSYAIVTVPANPALAGLAFSAQAFRADANQAPIPLAVSNGLAYLVPPVPPLILARGCMGSNTLPTGRTDLPVVIARFEQ